MRTEQPSTEGKKRTMSPAARKKISDAQKARHATQQGQQQSQPPTQTANFHDQFLGLIATTRSLTREQLGKEVEACIGPDNTIGAAADRHAIRELVTVLDQATGQRTMSAGGPQHV